MHASSTKKFQSLENEPEALARLGQRQSFCTTSELVPCRTLPATWRITCRMKVSSARRSSPCLKSDIFRKHVSTTPFLLSSHLHLVRKADMDIFKAAKLLRNAAGRSRLTGLIDQELRKECKGLTVHSRLFASQDRPRQKDRKSEVSLGFREDWACDGSFPNLCLQSWLKAPATSDHLGPVRQSSPWCVADRFGFLMRHAGTSALPRA